VIHVEIVNEQTGVAVDQSQIATAARNVLAGEGIEQATISIAVVDAAMMHRLNRQFLNHDYPTDVLSFPLNGTRDAIEGDIAVCPEVAALAATEYGWQTNDELLLYVIHGVLHLVGYDDKSADAKHRMRERERHYLDSFGLSPKYEDVGAQGR